MFITLGWWLIDHSKTSSTNTTMTSTRLHSDDPLPPLHSSTVYSDALWLSQFFALHLQKNLISLIKVPRDVNLHFCGSQSWGCLCLWVSRFRPRTYRHICAYVCAEFLPQATIKHARTSISSTGCLALRRGCSQRQILGLYYWNSLFQLPQMYKIFLPHFFKI